MRQSQVLVFVALAGCGGPGPQKPSVTTATEVSIDGAVIRARGDGIVTRDGRPIMMMTNDTVTDLQHNVVMTIEPDGSITGTGMGKHPRILPDDRVVEDDGSAALTLAADGSITLLNRGKPVPGTIKILHPSPQTRRTGELLVIATLIYEAVEHARAKAQATQTTPAAD